jgi:hypothetical protein
LLLDLPVDYVLIFLIITAVFAKVVKVYWKGIALYASSLESQIRLTISFHRFLVHIVVRQYLVLDVFGLELEQALDRKHLVCFEQLDKFEENGPDHVFQLRLVVCKLHVFVAVSADIDILHKLITILLILEVIVEYLHRRKLEEDPSLLDLVHNSFEEYRASFQEEGVLRVLLSVSDHHQVLLNDFILEENAKVGPEVELPLSVLLDFHLFFLEFVVGVRRPIVV